MLRVSIGTFVLNGQPSIRDGFYFDKEGFTGWDDGVEMQREQIKIPGQVGSFDLPGQLGSRLIELHGWQYCRPHELAEKKAEFKGLGLDGESFRIEVEHQGEREWATGSLTGRTKFNDRRGTGFATWALSLWCADPRIYGGVSRFGPGEAARHLGNFHARPKFVITGSMPSGYTIEGPAGRRFIVSQALTAGRVHTVDMEDGYLELDGIRQKEAVVRGDRWTIPRGAAVSHRLTPNAGAGSLVTLVPKTSV